MCVSISTFANQRHISYVDSGSGNPVVLIHAFPADQRLWQPQQNELSKYFRVITLDLWGFGKSSEVDGKAITMTEYADEVRQLLDQLHIQKAVIGGESMGGYIALAFLKKYPERANGLILSDTQAIADTDEIKQKRELSALDVLKNGTSNLINGFMPKALSTSAPEVTKQYLRHILDDQSSITVASALRGMALREDLTTSLENASLPVLIVTGDEDMVISPIQSEVMHQNAKNSKLVIIANAGHLSSLEKPDEWNEAVIKYFNAK